jgi:hypothetical protein
MTRLSVHSQRVLFWNEVSIQLRKEDKVIPVLNYAQYHENIRGIGDLHSRINLDTTWRSASRSGRFMLRTRWIGDWTYVSLNAMARTQTLLSLQGIETRLHRQ